MNFWNYEERYCLGKAAHVYEVEHVGKCTGGMPALRHKELIVSILSP